MTALVSEADTVSFVDARRRLFGIAWRVLGSAADAEDVVQDAWIRWHESDRSRVHDPVAFLATTTMRLALNVGQSARARHETGASVFDVADPAADPVGGAERGDAVSRALWTVLATLSPAERAVYVLREAFEYPHRRIAAVIGLSEANVRQVAVRARRRLASGVVRPVDAAEHAELVDAFTAAARAGELGRLERLLAARRSDVAGAARRDDRAGPAAVAVRRDQVAGRGFDVAGPRRDDVVGRGLDIAHPRGDGGADARLAA